METVEEELLQIQNLDQNQIRTQTLIKEQVEKLHLLKNLKNHNLNLRKNQHQLLNMKSLQVTKVQSF